MNREDLVDGMPLVCIYPYSSGRSEERTEKGDIYHANVHQSRGRKILSLRERPEGGPYPPCWFEPAAGSEFIPSEENARVYVAEGRASVFAIGNCSKSPDPEQNLPELTHEDPNAEMIDRDHIGNNRAITMEKLENAVPETPLKERYYTIRCFGAWEDERVISREIEY